MIKIKTAELTGPALDWAVEVAKGSSVYMRHNFMRRRYHSQRHHHLHDLGNLEWHLQMQKNEPIVGDLSTGETKFLPNNSTDWSQGGPIIEKAEITVQHTSDASKWRAWVWNDARENFWPVMYGSTPLIAAMRCYCCSKLGDVVDIPEELCQQQSS